MNSREIEKLLVRFYEGGTTLAEEEKIREFFLSEEIPPHLSSDAELFLGMAGASGEKIGDPSFEEEFLSRIDTTPVVHIDSRRNRVLYISGISAGILLLASFSLSGTISTSGRRTRNSRTRLPLMPRPARP